MDNFEENTHEVLQNVKKVADNLVSCHITELEKSLVEVMPILLKTVEQLYDRNTYIVQSRRDDFLDIISTNLQVALNIMDISNGILQHIMTIQSIAYSDIPSIPINVAQLIYLTFDHCKNSQNIYEQYHTSVSEILDIFKKTQELHSKYLILLHTHLIVDFHNESEISAYKKVLDIVLQISQVLSGMNMKSMADNWKSFISLLQKSSKDVVSQNVLSALQMLTEEINSNFLAISEMGQLGSKGSQIFKVTGFLVKVALKLFEIDFNVTENYEEIIKFWTMIYGWQPGFFKTNRFGEEITDGIYALYNLCTNSAAALMYDSTFIKQFCLVLDDILNLRPYFGSLLFINDLIKELPKLYRNEPNAFYSFKLASLVQLIFNLIKNCYMEYFYDYNSELYEELIVNMSALILLFPNQFSKVEIIFLESVVDDNIWAALIAMDTWCLVLQYSSDNVCRSTFTTLINKIDDLRLGAFHQRPEMIRLKILTQRMFKILSKTSKNEELSKYNPTTHLQKWKILNFRNIPPSHGHYVEFLLRDIIERRDVTENCSASDLFDYMESLDIISYTKFADLKVNTKRLAPCIARLWSFNTLDIPTDNHYFRYFICTLMKITRAVSAELDISDFILILTHIKSLSSEELFKLITCDVLEAIAGRNFNKHQDRHTLSSLLSDLLKSLLTDRNSVIVQLSLENFRLISHSHNYDNAVHRILATSTYTRNIVTNYTQKTAAVVKYDVKYFQKIQNFTCTHNCREWTNADQPASKKIKIHTEVDVAIDVLKGDTEKLMTIINKRDLNARQRNDVENVVNQLSILLK